MVQTLSLLKKSTRPLFPFSSSFPALMSIFVVLEAEASLTAGVTAFAQDGVWVGDEFYLLKEAGEEPLSFPEERELTLRCCLQ